MATTLEAIQAKIKKLQAQADALIAGIGNGLDDHTPTDGKARSDDCGY